MSNSVFLLKQIKNILIFHFILEPDLANVCLQAAGRIYFPHPTDNTKFLQCADGGRMFIIKCPKGEVFDRAITACRKVCIEFAVLMK